MRKERADEVARKIREVRELERRHRAASRRAKKFQTDSDYIGELRKKSKRFRKVSFYKSLTLLAVTTVLGTGGW